MRDVCAGGPRLEAPEGEGAAAVGEGAALLHPAVEAALQVDVHVLVVPGELVAAELLRAQERVHVGRLRLVARDAVDVDVHAQQFVKLRVSVYRLRRKLVLAVHSFLENYF